MMNPVLAKSYKKEHLKDPYDFIIIGSGIGGLACGALLSKKGKKVLVLEQHYVAGGFTHTFERKGYEWDVGLHYVGEVHRKNSILRRVFDYISDGNLGWAHMSETYDKVYFGDTVYEYVAGVQNFKSKMIGYFPKEEAAINQYIELVFQVAKSTRSFFMQKAMPQWLGPMTYPFLSRKFLSLASQTTYDVLSQITTNQKLMGVLSAQYGDYGLPPQKSSFAIHAMVAKHYFDGGNYPIGGSSSIAETIIPSIHQAGGDVLVRATVDQILIENGKTRGVLLKNGDEILAPVVISNAGVLNTFGKLIPTQIAKEKNLPSQLKMVAPSVAHICLYMGFKESAESLGLGQANYWIYPGYDHDHNIKAYLQNPKSDLPVTYISFPSAKDPTWDKRYPGRATMEVIGIAPYEWFAPWQDKPWHKRGEDYEANKEEFTQTLLNKVYHYLPQLKGKLDYSELSTPLSTRHFCNYEKGEIYGIDHTPQRFQQKWLKPQTPITGLYLTGQDIVTDGIGGALMAGVLTAATILKKNLVGEILKSKKSF